MKEYFPEIFLTPKGRWQHSRIRQFSLSTSHRVWYWRQNTSLQLSASGYNNCLVLSDAAPVYSAAAVTVDRKLVNISEHRPATTKPGTMSGGYRPAKCDGMRVIAKCCGNIDHYRPDQRHYHHGAAVHNGRSYPECGQIVPALLRYSALSSRHYLYTTARVTEAAATPR